MKNRQDPEDFSDMVTKIKANYYNKQEQRLGQTGAASVYQPLTAFEFGDEESMQKIGIDSTTFLVRQNKFGVNILQGFMRWHIIHQITCNIIPILMKMHFCKLIVADIRNLFQILR